MKIYSTDCSQKKPGNVSEWPSAGLPSAFWYSFLSYSLPATHYSLLPPKADICVNLCHNPSKSHAHAYDFPMKRLNPNHYYPQITQMNTDTNPPKGIYLCKSVSSVDKKCLPLWVRRSRAMSSVDKNSKTEKNKFRQDGQDEQDVRNQIQPILLILLILSKKQPIQTKPPSPFPPFPSVKIPFSFLCVKQIQ